jgi:hypothetical protein
MPAFAGMTALLLVQSFLKMGSSQAEANTEFFSTKTEQIRQEHA